MGESMERTSTADPTKPLMQEIRLIFQQAMSDLATLSGRSRNETDQPRNGSSTRSANDTSSAQAVKDRSSHAYSPYPIKTRRLSGFGPTPPPSGRTPPLHSVPLQDQDGADTPPLQSARFSPSEMTSPISPEGHSRSAFPERQTPSPGSQSSRSDRQAFPTKTDTAQRQRVKSEGAWVRDSPLTMDTSERHKEAAHVLFSLADSHRDGKTEVSPTQPRGIPLAGNFQTGAKNLAGEEKRPLVLSLQQPHRPLTPSPSSSDSGNTQSVASSTSPPPTRRVSQSSSPPVSRESVASTDHVYRLAEGQQIQLWQYLYELLQAGGKYSAAIAWTGNRGEFKLIDADRVSHLWGMRKNKRSMNYDKMSRAMRYYYDKDVLCKVPGKRYCYRFSDKVLSLMSSAYLSGTPAFEPSPLQKSTTSDKCPSPTSPLAQRPLKIVNIRREQKGESGKVKALSPLPVVQAGPGMIPTFTQLQPQVLTQVPTVNTGFRIISPGSYQPPGVIFAPTITSPTACLSNPGHLYRGVGSPVFLC